jgi:hypothetical protein
MDNLLEKSVTELTTKELGRAYVDRLLADGVEALDGGQTITADVAFFDTLREHVSLTVTQKN